MTDTSKPLVFPYRRNSDERGFFSTPFPPDILSQLNLPEVYISISRSNFVHTIRGMHFQKHPYAEAKLLTVLRGSIFDVLIDLNDDRSDSNRIYSFQFEEDRPEVLYIPKGFAHGYQTLTADTEILYALDSRYEPDSCAGYSPLSEGIKELWPFEPSVIKQEDLLWPTLP
jgi:dTDP-4-dehydrorhamnose 3,5-epimerase